MQEYLALLPERPNYSIADFQWERQQWQQTIIAQPASAPAMPRVRLLDAPLDPVTLADTLALVERYVVRNRPHQIVTLNVDLIKTVQQHPRFRAIVNSAELSIADGKPLLWAARWTGQHLPERITGTDLVLGAAQLAAQRGEPMFFLGAAEGVAAQAAAHVQSLYPNVRIECYSPPMGTFSPDDNRRMIEMIRASGARYLFVALGSPRGQIWLDDHLDELGVPVCAEIGGVFNFLAGTIKRAPAWVQNNGFEWLYRIVQEPGRLWRRYVIEDMPVFVRMLCQPVTAGSVVRTSASSQPLPRPAHERKAHAGRLERAVGGS